MTFGFIITAAPASQPVPTPDAAALAVAADSGSADAFDAALAETLAVIDRQASRETTVGGSGPPMPAEWLFPVLSAPIDAEAGVVAIESRAADAAPDDDIPEATSGDAPIDVTVPVEVAGLVTSAAPVVPVAATTSVADAAAETPAAVPVRAEAPAKPIAFAPATAVRAADAGGPEGPPLRTEPGDALAAPIGPVTASSPSSTETTTSPAAAAPVTAVAPAVTVPAVAVQPPAVQAPTESTETPAPIADAAGQVAEPSVPGVGSGRPVMTAAASESRRAAMRYMAGAAQQMNASDPAAPVPMASAPSASPVASAPSAAVVDVAATAVVAVPAAIPAAVSRAADTTTTATPPSAAAIKIEAGAQPDTPMSGDEDPSQGHGRPSPEFVRFAAALSLAGVIERDDNGRASAHVAVAPVAQAAQAAPAAATATTVVAAPTAPSTMTPGEENIGRLVQAMRVNARPGAWEATVRLNPEHLGAVTIALRVERNSVTAVVNADAAGVRQWLEMQEQAVRSGMAEHGLHLERFVVQRDGQRRDPQEPERHPQPRKRQPPRDAQGAERFEIHV